MNISRLTGIESENTVRKVRIPALDTGGVVVVVIVKEELKAPKEAATSSQVWCGYP